MSYKFLWKLSTGFALGQAACAPAPQPTPTAILIPAAAGSIPTPVTVSMLTPGREEIRGLEYHYSAWVNRPKGLEPASNIHLSFWAKPDLACRLTHRCCQPSSHTG